MPKTDEVEEDGNAEEEKSSVHERAVARKKFVQRDAGVLRVQDALEHVLVTGTKIGRDGLRRQEFERKELNRVEGTIDCPPRDVVASQKRGPQPKARRKPAA
eukprot:CAMPEP_0201206504 /NCGR_PEP_ID=MMETSP0851-20130426/172844_1 /ASSEMBLY_ACC=CAM_ASM_000631 /TAXON_ID=183588 /ORGANISM="Pseudo-nitzschia fraudulenta, Strain WWA7" /LENGTH=101 /DNA_ID=CAMNT_0047494859 /DNA_START=114 /DNA_END=415 /DNA_ORIENTATION=+